LFEDTAERDSYGIYNERGRPEGDIRDIVVITGLKSGGRCALGFLPTFGLSQK